MPVPIKLINNNNFSDEKNEDRNVMDVSFLANSINNLQKTSSYYYVSDKDAEVIMDIWLNSSKKDDDTYSLSKTSNITNNDVLRLKSRGLLTGGAKEVKFTEKAKKVICTMTLGESNKFLSTRKNKSYTEILASMNKKDKSGYRIPKFSSYSHLLNIKD